MQQLRGLLQPQKSQMVVLGNGNICYVPCLRPLTERVDSGSVATDIVVCLGEGRVVHPGGKVWQHHDHCTNKHHEHT